jgi:solute:Na+ symporter, SSS family
LGLLHEWGAAGSRFGIVVTWFLLGGDLYTAYTFIAVPALLFGVEPAWSSVPFFYWYQLLWIPIAVIALTPVFNAIHAVRGEDETPAEHYV